MGFTSVGTGVTGTALTMDAGYIVDRVANLMRRADMKPEIMHWVHLAQQELSQRAKFPELRVGISYPVQAGVFYYALPDDFAQIDRVFYTASYVSPAQTKALEPLPRKFMGEPQDLQSLLENDGNTGDPQYFFIREGLLAINTKPSSVPAEITMYYYKTPGDLVSTLDIPAINAQWRQYLIWIALNWAKSAIEQEDVTKAFAWDSKAEKIMDKVARKVNIRENPRETYVLPDNGLEQLDSIY